MPFKQTEYVIKWINSFSQSGFATYVAFSFLHKKKPQDLVFFHDLSNRKPLDDDFSQETTAPSYHDIYPYDNIIPFKFWRVEFIK